MKASEFELEQSYAYQAYLLARALRKDFFRIVRSNGIDLFPEQWFALYYIVNQPGLSQSELAVFSFEDRPSLSRSLATMTKKGLIRAFRDTNDARVLRYEVTSLGEDVFQDMIGVMNKERKRVFSGLTDADFQQFRKIVDTLIGNMS
jgi:DNA-binding MarR family transcriptional regulator